MVVVLMDLLEHEDQNTKAVKRLHHAKILCGVAVTTLYIRAMGPIRKAVVWCPSLDAARTTSIWLMGLNWRDALVRAQNLGAARMTSQKPVGQTLKAVDVFRPSMDAAQTTLHRLKDLDSKAVLVTPMNMGVVQMENPLLEDLVR
jgi:hypothetical protein